MTVNTSDALEPPGEGGQAYTLPQIPGKRITAVVENEDGSVTFHTEEVPTHGDGDHEFVRIGYGWVHDETKPRSKAKYMGSERCGCGKTRQAPVSKAEHDEPPHEHEFACVSCGVAGVTA